MTNEMINLKNLNVTFQQKNNRIEAVKNVTLEINKGDIYGIVGYSGAGKSTLARTINLLQVPTSGIVKVKKKTFFEKKGNYINVIPRKQLRSQRQKIGMIFQHFNLLYERTVIENIEFALKHSGLKEKEINEKSLRLLKIVGLNRYANSFPSQLSGGQQQRVAIARALANNPEILISDESTSALDPHNTNQILDLLKSLNKKLGLTVVLITHEIEAVKRIANKVAVMQNGKIIEKGKLIDIFIKPKKTLTQKFVGFNQKPIKAINILNKSGKGLKGNEKYIKLTYIGSEVTEPIIEHLYKNLNVQINIIYGNVDFFGETLVGTLFAIISGTSENQSKGLDFLRKENVNVEKINSKRTKEK